MSANLTQITTVLNYTQGVLYFFNTETNNKSVTLPAGLGTAPSSTTINQNVPWVPNIGQFDSHHMSISSTNNGSENLYFIWQSGNNVYWSVNIPSSATGGTILVAQGNPTTITISADGLTGTAN
jgi:hypothetical protein